MAISSRGIRTSTLALMALGAVGAAAPSALAILGSFGPSDGYSLSVYSGSVNWCDVSYYNAGGYGINAGNGCFVTFGFAEIEQLAGVVQAPAQAAHAVDHALELGALPAQLLGTRGIVPDIGVFQLAADFFQTLGPGIEVKDTPVGIAGVG